MQKQHPPKKSLTIQNAPRPLAAFQLLKEVESPLTEEALRPLAHTLAADLKFTTPTIKIQTFPSEQALIQLSNKGRNRVKVGIDPIAHLLYFVADEAHAAQLLTTLGAALFPSSPTDEIFQEAHFNLAALPYLLKEMRHFKHLAVNTVDVQLKYVRSSDFGYNAPEQALQWPHDGFDAMDVGAFTWPQKIAEVRLGVYIKPSQTPFSLGIYHASNHLRAPLSTKTILPLSEILRRILIHTKRGASSEKTPITSAYTLHEETVPREFQKPPHPYNCPLTPYGKNTVYYCPSSLIDALRFTHQTQGNPATHCILLDTPDTLNAIPPEALVTWAETCQRSTHQLICAALKGKRFPCGNNPRCLTQKALLRRALTDDLEEINQLREQRTYSHQGLHKTFPTLSADELEILHAWSIEEDPHKTGHAIRFKILEERFKINTRQIYRIIEKARLANPSSLKSLETYRKIRATITHARDTRDA